MEADRAAAIVIAAHGRLFATETEDGVCMVYRHSAGPLPGAGDIVLGPVARPDTTSLTHDDGVCDVTVEQGPVSREAALAITRRGGVEG